MKQAVKAGATVLVVGCSGDFASLPLAHMAANEIDLKLQFRYANQYPKAIRLVEAGLINLKPLVTVRSRFSILRALATFADSPIVPLASLLPREFYRCVSHCS